jgi:hypothetical protein
MRRLALVKKKLFNKKSFLKKILIYHSCLQKKKKNTSKLKLYQYFIGKKIGCLISALLSCKRGDLKSWCASKEVHLSCFSLKFITKERSEISIFFVIQLKIPFFIQNSVCSARWDSLKIYHFLFPYILSYITLASAFISLNSSSGLVIFFYLVFFSVAF